LCFYPRRIITLLETPLLILTFLSAAALLLALFEDPQSERYSHRRRLYLALAGTLCAAMSLARIDSLIFVAAFLLPLALRFRLARADILVYLLPCTLIAIAYAAINQIAFGTPLPISGRVKLDITSSFACLPTMSSAGALPVRATRQFSSSPGLAP
jgi:hypothetical protein